jgi:hypothetical protein
MSNHLVTLSTLITRCFSTTNSLFQSPTSLVIPVFGLKGGYASALFSAASK